MSYFTSFCMFFTSFFPLWVAIVFIDIKSIIDNKVDIITECLSVSCIAILFFVSIIVLFAVFKSAKNKKKKTKQYTLDSVTKQKSVTAEFVLTYIVPLIAFDFTHWEGTVLFSFFFLILSILCIKHSYFSVNVLLELLKYRFFICDLSNVDEKIIQKIVISKKSLPANCGDKVKTVTLNNEYLLEVDI